jgi:hypothetical protein
MHDWTDVLRTAPNKSISGLLHGRSLFLSTNQSPHFYLKIGQPFQPISSPTQVMSSTIFLRDTMQKLMAVLLVAHTRPLLVWLMP